MLRFQNLLVTKYLECFFKLTKCRETLLFALFLATDKNNRKINMINIDKEINGSHLQDNSGTIMTS